MPEAHVGVAQGLVMVSVSPWAVVGAAVASVPVLADDELGGDLFARGLPAVDLAFIQVKVSLGVVDGWSFEGVSGRAVL